MSQFILDDQLDLPVLLPALRAWTTAERLGDLRPGEHVLDDRVPEILLTVKQPTFITIDHGFWHSRWCHPNYCILYFALLLEQQAKLPIMLRSLLRQSEFRTRAARMGKVVAVTPTAIRFWEFSVHELQQIKWPRLPR